MKEEGRSKKEEGRRENCLWIVFDSAIKVSTLVSTLKEEGRRKKEEGRRKKEEGRRENCLWIVFDSAIKVSTLVSTLK
ncbi:MAG: hypothetical protein F6K23_09165 [Okeania sp. SIO2C9]|uniref:hypothetical protein n=1 Tax=Okeania sp. SIO2C9 TaxID=2607791 RepID=UPI0013C0A110|nr:hypothetical protein [Okeania sp. SIO2C9]NEQ73231.1 hypothetical protein [Okeania sp. SIO2C9]